MKQEIIPVGILSALILFATPEAGAWVQRSKESCRSGVSGIACEKRMTRTNLKNDGSGEWLHSSDAFYFRNDSGPKSCTFSVDKMRTTLNNAHISYARTFSNRNFGWEGPLLVEQARAGAWTYQLVWTTKCNN